MIGVILAAGAGARLGGVAKALLEIGADETFLGRIARTGRAAGMSRAIVVVAEPFADRVARAAEALGLEVATNPDPSRGMGSSVQIGFSTVLSDQNGDGEALLWPVDTPRVAVDTIKRMRRARGGSSVVVPTHGGRGGHPVLVDRSLWSALATSADRAGGARAVFDAHRESVLRIEVGDPWVVRDVDLPEDLRSVAGGTR